MKTLTWLAQTVGYLAVGAALAGIPLGLAAYFREPIFVALLG